jgi:hypothetical protein
LITRLLAEAMNESIKAKDIPIILLLFRSLDKLDLTEDVEDDRYWREKMEGLMNYQKVSGAMLYGKLHPRPWLFGSVASSCMKGVEVLSNNVRYFPSTHEEAVSPYSTYVSFLDDCLCRFPLPVFIFQELNQNAALIVLRYFGNINYERKLHYELNCTRLFVRDKTFSGEPYVNN